jgi:hypothetical protein
MFKRNLISTQKIIITDGIPSSGKALVCNLVSGLPKVEQWIMNYWFDQILSLYNLKKINLETVVNLLKTNHNQLIYDNCLLRHSNFKIDDATSVTKHPRYKIIKKRMLESDKKNFEKNKNKMIMHYCTHMISNFSEPLFKSFTNKLVYIRIFRSPLNVGMLKRLAYFSKIWEKSKSRDGHIKIFDKSSKKNIHHLIYKKKKNYKNINSYEKAVLILEEIFNLKKLKKIENISKIYRSKLITIPFENLIVNPNKYLQSLSKVLNVKLDKISKKTLAFNNVPRKINLNKEKDEGLRFLENKIDNLHLKKIIKINKNYENHILNIC